VSTFELEIWDDETEKVTFYSPKLEGSAYSEMDKFLLRMEELPDIKESLRELLELVREVIGTTYGAQDAFFNRYENRVTALPPKGHVKISELELDYHGFPLRLYCLALNEEVVILFNGGIKNAKTVQESTDVISTKFYEANEFAKRILEAINTGEIIVTGRVITDYRGNTEIYL
jgi:hypothetical protein